MLMRGSVKRIGHILGTLALLLVRPVSAQPVPDGGPPIREVPVPGLPQGGLSAYDAWGPVIYFNPQLKSLGPGVFTFLRFHEYGHHRLGHVTPQMVQLFASNPYYAAWIKKPLELAADCYGARELANLSPELVEQAARYFELGQGPFAGAPFYPSGLERAAQIRKCAGGMSNGVISGDAQVKPTTPKPRQAERERPRTAEDSKDRRDDGTTNEFKLKECEDRCSDEGERCSKQNADRYDRCTSECEGRHSDESFDRCFDNCDRGDKRADQQCESAEKVCNDRCDSLYSE